jgi:hypothetical protein
MSIKSKVFAGAAALSVMAGGLGVAAATANATTPSCFVNNCVAISNGGAVLDSYKRSTALGNKVILWGDSNVDPATDFIKYRVGTVAEFLWEGLISKTFAAQFPPNDRVFEVEYAPYGNPSHKCVGVDGSQGGQVNLRNCGVSANTLWVQKGPSTGAVLVSAASKNFDDPNVLSNRNGDLFASALNVLQGHQVADNQIWSISYGAGQ